MYRKAKKKFVIWTLNNLFDFLFKFAVRAQLSI